MPVPPTRLLVALHGLEQLLDVPHTSGIALGNWRWQVRQRVAAVREALMTQSVPGGPDGWLAARGGTAFGERNELLARLSALGPRVLVTRDVEDTRVEIRRVVADVRRHLHPGADQAHHPA